MTFGGLKLKIKNLRNFIKNHLLIAALDGNARNAINNNFKLQTEKIIQDIEKLEAEVKEKLMEDLKPIYTVTTYRPGYNKTRIPGYFFNFSDAEIAVKENSCDIWEFYYDFAVIEEVHPGIYTFPRKEWWYRFDTEKDAYIPIEKPDRFKRSVCWGIG